MSDSAMQLLAISVGNTRTSFGVFSGRKARFTRAVPNESFDALIAALAEAPRDFEADAPSAIVLASVVPAMSERVIEKLSAALGRGVYLLGDDLPIPIRTALDPEATTGHDRLLAALAAFDVVRQACVVIDAGTAITVDFVDGVGVYQGGAILPGPRMALHALHAGAAQLPQVDFTSPDGAETFGRNTREAMLNGVFHGARGAVRLLIERYAEAYGAYPQIIATGGDAHTLFEDDELIEHIADDLVLRGVAIACEAALTGEEADEYGPETGGAA